MSSVPVQLKATIEPDSARQLSALLVETSHALKKSAGACFHWAAILWLKSARANTPISRKRRPYRRASDAGAADRYEYEWWSRSITEAQWRPTNAPRTDPRLNIKTRGCARNSWAGAFRGLGESGGSATGYEPPPGTSTAKDLTAETVAGVELTNRLFYLEDIAPRLAEETWPRVIHAFEARLTADVRRRMAALWGSI